MLAQLRRCRWIILVVLGTGLVSVPQVCGQTPDAFAAARRKMVDELIAPEGVTDERVLESVRTVPRHLFVRPQLRPLAYTDQSLDIGHKQTISSPFIVAYMTQMLDPQPADRVLEIGTGSGYQAAVLSGLVKEVYSIEIVEALGKRAEALLKSLKYSNVTTKVGDGYLGWPDKAPFDKIIVTCSPENIPQPLIDQLKEGGKMIIPVGERYQQVFYLLEKHDGKLEQTKLMSTLFVPMTGAAEKARERKPDPLHPEIFNGGFELDADDDKLPDNWFYFRRMTLTDEKAFGGKMCLKFDNNDRGHLAQALQAFAIDGSHLTKLVVTARHRQHNINSGPEDGMRPGAIVHYFDGRRIPIAHTPVGPWLADDDEWQTTTKTIVVPKEAREAILQIGLNGATGTLWVDDVSVSVPK